MVAVGRDGEDLIALTLGQELMFALHHADSRPQKVIWAYGQRRVNPETPRCGPACRSAN
jgi:hypothetical protein